MLDNIFNTIICWFKGHLYTCNAEEDIPPTNEQVQDGFDGFKDYAVMYCKRCEKEFPYDW